MGRSEQVKISDSLRNTLDFVAARFANEPDLALITLHLRQDFQINRNGQVILIGGSIFDEKAKKLQEAFQQARKRLDLKSIAANGKRSA